MITKNDEDKSLEHRYSGNGWAVVQWLPNDYCRVVGWSFRPENAKDPGPPIPKIGKQAFLAWRKLLTVEQELSPPDYKDKRIVVLPDPVVALLDSTRKRLESGELKIVSTRFV